MKYAICLLLLMPKIVAADCPLPIITPHQESWQSDPSVPNAALTQFFSNMGRGIAEDRNNTAMQKYQNCLRQEQLQEHQLEMQQQEQFQEQQLEIQKLEIQRRQLEIQKQQLELQQKQINQQQ